MGEKEKLNEREKPIENKKASSLIANFIDRKIAIENIKQTATSKRNISLLQRNKEVRK
ncbi:hypothetical protein FACS189418_6900 [Clostridia bacterium]|nr:hypothetical protein FACS189418_6900 [Clostridia bacterium]